MLPVVDRPLIQYAVEEALAAGITGIVLVAGRNKTAIEKYFRRDPGLERELNDRGKKDLMSSPGASPDSLIICSAR